MSQIFAMIACRFFGRGCPISRPASRDLVREMKEQTRRGEAELIEFRKWREADRDLSKTLGVPPPWRKSGGET